jgi:hypothetical protein
VRDREAISIGSAFDFFGARRAFSRFSNNKKRQHTPAKHRRRGWPKTLPFISPSEERFAFLRLPQITLEAFSMMGAAFLRWDKYHTEKVCQEAFILKIN